MTGSFPFIEVCLNEPLFFIKINCRISIRFGAKHQKVVPFCWYNPIHVYRRSSTWDIKITSLPVLIWLVQEGKSDLIRAFSRGLIPFAIAIHAQNGSHGFQCLILSVYCPHHQRIIFKLYFPLLNHPSEEPIGKRIKCFPCHLWRHSPHFLLCTWPSLKLQGRLLMILGKYRFSINILLKSSYI